MSTPIYAATVADLGIDPATTTTSRLIDRQQRHIAWFNAAWGRALGAAS